MRPSHLLPIFQEEPSSPLILDPKSKKKKACPIFLFHHPFLLPLFPSLRNNETLLNEDVLLLIIRCSLLVAFQPVDQDRREVSLCLQRLQPIVVVTCVVVFIISKWQHTPAILSKGIYLLLLLSKAHLLWPGYSSKSVSITSSSSPISQSTFSVVVVSMLMHDLRVELLFSSCSSLLWHKCTREKHVVEKERQSPWTRASWGRLDCSSKWKLQPGSVRPLPGGSAAD